MLVIMKLFYISVSIIGRLKVFLLSSCTAAVFTSETESPKAIKSAGLVSDLPKHSHRVKYHLHFNKIDKFFFLFGILEHVILLSFSLLKC